MPWEEVHVRLASEEQPDPGTQGEQMHRAEYVAFPQMFPRYVYVCVGGGGHALAARIPVCF